MLTLVLVDMMLSSLDIEAQLGSGSLIKVDVIDDWLGSVLNWAEEEVLQVAGGIVSHHLQAKLYVLISFILLARCFLCEEP